MALLERFRRLPEPQADGPITYERLDLPGRLIRDKGWPRNLQAVRRTLPEHLHDSPPAGGAYRGSWVVVAKAGGVPVGLAWTVHSAGDQSGAYIEEVAVLRSHQGRGIGQQLLRETAKWMIELGRQNLSIYPSTGARWVTRVGFRPVGGDTYGADARDVS